MMHSLKIAVDKILTTKILYNKPHPTIIYFLACDPPYRLRNHKNHLIHDSMWSRRNRFYILKIYLFHRDPYENQISELFEHRNFNKSDSPKPLFPIA